MSSNELGTVNLDSFEQIIANYGLNNKLYMDSIAIKLNKMGEEMDD